MFMEVCGVDVKKYFEVQLSTVYIYICYGIIYVLR